MGIGASKRVEEALISSPVFTAACESVYDDCLAEAQHAFAGVRPYQLGDAGDRLHAALSRSLPLVRRWVPLPPPRQEVDKAFCRVAGASADALHLPEFKAFATELFRGAIMAGAGAAVARRIPIGVAGIAGAGAVVRARVGNVAKLAGIYSVGVAAAVYFSLR